MSSINTLYIKFEDTVHDGSNNQKEAIDHIVLQLIAAAKAIEANRNAVYDYLRSDKSVPITTAISLFNNPALLEKAVSADIDNEIEGMLTSVFTKLKRTKKSERIVRHFINNSGHDISINELMEGCSMSKNDMASWLATTGKNIPAIVNPTRGVYKFNPDKLSIK